MTPETLKEAIEELIDECTIERFIEAFAVVCYLKSQHLISNWQETYTASLWEKLGDKIGRLTL